GSNTRLLVDVRSGSSLGILALLIRRFHMGIVVKGGGKRGGGGAKGGGKKGGGKGKPGQGGGPGQGTLCFNPTDYATLKAAFDGAVKSAGPPDVCERGNMRVCLDTADAVLLISTLVGALHGANVKKKKGKGKGKAILVGGPKLKGKMKRSA